MNYYLKSVEDTLKEVDSTTEGLSSAEAARRLEANGKNKLAEPPKKTFVQKFIDSLTIMGLIFLIIGVLVSLLRHGDFDIMEYVAKRSLHKSDIKPFKAFKEDKKENRKDGFNYPFCVCVLLFLAAGILTFFVY